MKQSRPMLLCLAIELLTTVVPHKFIERTKDLQCKEEQLKKWVKTLVTYHLLKKCDLQGRLQLFLHNTNFTTLIFTTTPSVSAHLVTHDSRIVFFGFY